MCAIFIVEFALGETPSIIADNSDDDDVKPALDTFQSASNMPSMSSMEWMKGGVSDALILHFHGGGFVAHTSKVYNLKYLAQ